MTTLLLAIVALLAVLVVGLVLGAASKNKRSQRRAKHLKTSNLVLISLGVFALAFIVTMIVVFCIKGSVPDTLIQYTLGAGGVEAAALSAIKIAKVKRGVKEESE